MCDLLLEIRDALKPILILFAVCILGFLIGVSVAVFVERHINEKLLEHNAEIVEACTG